MKWLLVFCQRLKSKYRKLFMKKKFIHFRDNTWAGWTTVEISENGVSSFLQWLNIVGYQDSSSWVRVGDSIDPDDCSDPLEPVTMPKGIANIALQRILCLAMAHK